MPTIEWNRRMWRAAYDWSREGEEWSGEWGSSEAQWYGTILPRIGSFLPARNILEIAPGFGRWTRFLVQQCQRYVGVDLSDKCVDHCRQKIPTQWSWRGRPVRFLVNDGFDLSMVSDRSIDFVYSFDSLVHADAEVMKSYVPQILAKLTPEGAAFIHHSNDASAKNPGGYNHQRDPSVSAQTMKDLVAAAGGHILRQEIIDWGGAPRLDCLTLFGRTGLHNPATTTVVNDGFMQEARHVREKIAPWQVRRR